MKNTRTKLLVIPVFICFIFVSVANSQNVTAHREPAIERAIPKLVIETFKDQYPDILLIGWYITHLVYWQNDYSSNWYTGWYTQRTIVTYNYEKPNYFEVEFVDQPGELSRAIYNRYGYWYETRTKISGLTMAIYDSIKESKYSGWEISKTMEKLESPMWPMEIYRFHVSKGVKSQIIRMDAKGNIIQAKILNE